MVRSLRRRIGRVGRRGKPVKMLGEIAIGQHRILNFGYMRSRQVESMLLELDNVIVILPGEYRIGDLENTIDLLNHPPTPSAWILILDGRCDGGVSYELRELDNDDGYYPAIEE